MILVAGKWYDWFGGLTWGYRSIVDTAPFLALLMIPILERMLAGRATRALFAALLAWSVGAQFVGAWSYSAVGWHNMTLQYDDPNHASVWLWSRPQIGYHLANFAAERARKRELMAGYVGNESPILILREGAPAAEARGGDLLVVRERARPAPFHDHAEALRIEGRHEEALAYYRAALAIDARFVPAYAGMGDALYRLQRHEEATELLARALALQPEPAHAVPLLRLMGQVADALGRPEAAAQHYERAVELDPRDAEAVDLLAMVRFGQQRYAAALDLYRTLVELRPGSAQAHSNLGVTLFYLDRGDEAIGSFEHALSLDPDLETPRAALRHLRNIR